MIRNFCIIAHIDHGKSTLADRMLELTGTVAAREMRDQMLDQMDLEREKGITIKLQPVRMAWSLKSTNLKTQSPNKTQDSKHKTQEYILNLIDTPGHVDFQYEVSRSLQAVEGAILLVDATQGVQAQTLANLYLALEQNLTVIPVVNKIDLPAANVAGAMAELTKLLGVEEGDVLKISAKTGEGVRELLDEVVKKIPSPQSTKPKQNTDSRLQSTNLRALIFDSIYDDYKGVVAYVRVVEGEVKRGDMVQFLGTGASDRAVEVGVFRPKLEATEKLSAGEIGYIATGLKNIREARVGDTITRHIGWLQPGSVKSLPGFRIPQPKIFAGVYPARGDDFHLLREAMGKLQLNDASLSAQQERSQALGQGFRCGFLGMLHLEIVQERLSREHDLDVVVTTPSVMYRVQLRGGAVLEVQTPDQFPDAGQVEKTEEQLARVEVIVPKEYMGTVFEVMKEREGILEHQEYLGSDRLVLRFRLPLRELVVDLYDQLKSATAGYGSMSYEVTGWQDTDVVKLSILINEEVVEALSTITPRSKAERMGRRMAEKLKNVIPRQLFAVPIQAAIGGKIVARETLAAMRKDVTGHLYGGDVTRKRKLLEKQKKGKKKLASRGQVDIPPSAYIDVLKR